jgi:hypothetical protein
MPRPKLTPLKRSAFAVAAAAAVAVGPVAISSPAQAETLGERNGGQVGTAAVAPTQALAFGRWEVFEVGATGSRSVIFTFSSDTPVLLRVTDALCRGDEFRVFDRSFAIFNTTSVPVDPSCDDEPFVGAGPQAWADPSYSKGRFLLQPGHHRVRVQITESPFGAAGAFLRIDKRPIS